MNDLERFQNVFNGVVPYAGDVPKGFFVDFLGRMTDAHFHAAQAGESHDPEAFPGGFVQTALPELADDEFWFEAVDWVEAAEPDRW